MRNSIFDYVGNLDTLLAVILGAVLATFGALFAEVIQERRNRKRQERDAARFFGDLLTTFDDVLDFAFRSQTFGDPWGPLTIRLFKTALREAQIYERNRERLFDIQDMALRSRIHVHFLVETFPLEAMIDNCERMNDINEKLKSDTSLTRAQVSALETEIKDIVESLESGLSAIKRERARTKELFVDIEKIGKVNFDQRDVQTYITGAIQPLAETDHQDS